MENKQKILITSYRNPDVDGTGCAYAYAEFLKNKEVDAIAAFFGKIHREAQFVVDEFNIVVNKAEDFIDEYNKIILVDSSEIVSLPGEIKHGQVIEIIDHRQSDDLDKFTNAKVQIELVGSCATLIAEKFYNEKMNISRESAALLYSAIVSNTINFKVNRTTEKDKAMAEWLKNKLDLPTDYIHKMFAHKSALTAPLKEILLADFKKIDFKDKKIGIAQLEIIDIEKFTDKNLEKTKKVLSGIKEDNGLDYIFLNCIDIEKGFNIFIVIDESTKKLVSSALEIYFEDSGIAKIDYLLMRKEIVPKLKKYLSI